MKSLIQLVLLLLIFVVGYLFYKNFFLNETKNIIEKTESETQNNLKDSNLDNNSNISSDSTNEIPEKSLIKNLSYKVDFAESGKYEIKAELSELTYVNATEVVIMYDVAAVIIDQNNSRIDIKSDKALLDTNSYNTNFSENVNIKYLTNIISSNSLNFNFNENIIILSEDIIYKNTNTKIRADNVKINLLNKDINIFMNNPEDKIELIHIE